MGVKIICRNGLYIEERSGANRFEFLKRYFFEPSLKVVTSSSRWDTLEAKKIFAVGEFRKSFFGVAIAPHGVPLAPQSVILDNIDNGIDFRFIPYDAISNNGVPIYYIEPQFFQYVMKNPYLTNPTSYDDCILTWERVVRPTFLRKVM